MRDMRAIVRGRVMEARVIEGSISGMIWFLEVVIKDWATLTTYQFTGDIRQSQQQQTNVCVLRTTLVK